jgi:hypothetical protein
LEQLAAGFSEHSRGLLDGCVLAIDGFGMHTCCPFKTEVSRQKDYWFRKGGFAFIVLVGCDIDGQFISAQANHSGSTNDIIAWQHPSYVNLLKMVNEDGQLTNEDGQLPSCFFHW